MREEVRQIDPAKCPYKFDGHNIARLSRAKLRQLSKRLGLPAGPERKIELYDRIMYRLGSTAWPAGDDLKKHKAGEAL